MNSPRTISLLVEDADIENCTEIFIVFKDEKGNVINADYVTSFTVLPGTTMEEMRKV